VLNRQQSNSSNDSIAESEVRAYSTGSTYLAYKNRKRTTQLRTNKDVAARANSFLANSSDDTDGDADDEYDNTFYGTTSNDCDTTTHQI
jgi:hypothetical protein